MPLDNAMFLGPVAALAQGQVSVHDLDDLGHSGFVVRARHGAIAIAGKTWQGTQQGISAYLQRDGRRAPATKSSFLHELYLFEPLCCCSNLRWQSSLALCN